MKKIDELKILVNKSWKFILAISYISILVISIISFGFYQQARIDSFYEYNKTMQESFKLLVNHSLDTVRYASYNAFFTNEIQQLRKSEDISNYQATRSLRILNSLAGTNPFIHSIYVHNKAQDIVYSTESGTMPYDEFNDSSAFNHKDLFVREIDSNKNDDWVYTLSFSDYNEQTPSMVVNINANSFNNSLFNSDENHESIYVPYMNKVFSQYSQPDSISDYIKRTKLEKDNGYALYDNKVLFYSYQSEYDIYFLREVSSNTIENIVVSVSPLLFSIIFSTLFALLALSWIVNKYYHKPLFTILDEFEIQNTNKKSIHEAIGFWIEDQKQKIVKNQQNAKFSFLKNHLSKAAAQTNQEIIPLNINTNKPLRLILLQVKNESLVLPLFENEKEWVWINDLLFVIVHKIDSDALNIYANSRKVRIFQSKETNYNYLYLKYQQLTELYNLRILHPNKYFFKESEIPKIDIQFDDLTSIEQDFISQLSHGKKEEALVLLRQWIEKVKPLRYTSLIFFYNKLYIEIYDIVDRRLAYDKYLSVTDFETQIRMTQNIEEINRLLETVTTDFCDYLQYERDKKNVLFAKEIQEYIDIHLSDFELTPDSVSTHFGFNSTYLSRFFKQYTQTSISEYILDTRLNKAKDLLISTSLSIKEISESVGIQNSNYFFTLFRKHFDITPAQFRAQNK